MKLSCYVLVGIVSLLSCLTVPVNADSKVNITTTYYEIMGTTATDLRNEMNAKTPVYQDGKGFDAHTSWYVRWRYQWEKNSDSCRIIKVITEVDVNFTFPKWINRENAGNDLKQKWDRYYNALITHENGHRDFAVNAAKEIESAILGMGERSDCDVLESDATNLGYGILNKYLKLEKQYDMDTHHGMTTGAVFP